MTAAERKLLAIEIAEEMLKRTDKILFEKELQERLGANNGGLRYRKKQGAPIRHKEGVGYYALESEVMKFLKS